MAHGAADAGAARCLASCLATLSPAGLLVDAPCEARLGPLTCPTFPTSTGAAGAPLSAPCMPESPPPGAAPLSACDAMAPAVSRPPYASPCSPCSCCSSSRRSLAQADDPGGGTRHSGLTAQWQCCPRLLLNCLCLLRLLLPQPPLPAAASRPRPAPAGVAERGVTGAVARAAAIGWYGDMALNISHGSGRGLSICCSGRACDGSHAITPTPGM